MVQYSATGLPKTTCTIFISLNSHSCLHVPISHCLYSVLTHFGATPQIGSGNSDPTEKVTLQKRASNIFWSDKFPGWIHHPAAQMLHAQGQHVRKEWPQREKERSVTVSAQATSNANRLIIKLVPWCLHTDGLRTGFTLDMVSHSLH